MGRPCENFPAFGGGGGRWLYIAYIEGTPAGVSLRTTQTACPGFWVPGLLPPCSLPFPGHWHASWQEVRRRKRRGEGKGTSEH